MTDLKEDITNILPSTIETRRYLHENPELSSKEYETSKYLKKRIQGLGLDIHDVPGTGFYAVLDTGIAGKTLGLRTDIDALPIEESNLNLTGAKAVISKTEGISHACGHDGHMAILLSTMELMVKHKNMIRGKVIFIFEEGEEIGAGIDAMVEALKKEKLNAIYGNHLLSSLDTGKISVNEGPVMAGVSKIEFKVKGKSGHGSRPDLAINPIFVTAQILNGISSAWNNRLNVTKITTLGLTQIHGGTQNNIIPDEVFVGGTLRFFDIEEGKKATKLLYRVAQKTAEAHESSIEIIGRKLMHPLINDYNLSVIAKKSINEIFPQALIDAEPWFASETFGVYQQLCPVVFSFIGIKNKHLGSGAEHHTKEFDLDEKSLFYGIGSMFKFSLDYLKNI